MRRVGRFLAAGEADALALVLSEPLSFWGGVDAADGTIIDRSHPACGTRVTGTILVMPSGRGSSSSSAVLAEVTRRGVGPLAIILARPDHILTAGSLVARFLYDRSCPIVVCKTAGLVSGQRLRITAAAGGDAQVDTVDGDRGGVDENGP